MVDIWAQDGWVTGQGASLVENPASSSYFLGNPYGLEYLVWPESMFPDCYLSTAVCTGLVRTTTVVVCEGLPLPGTAP
jgi:hypothetical protein